MQLFPGSIKDNIGRMRSDATDAAIYQAAKLADVHEMIASMPHGYETVVSVDGSPLSGGQKQRVALARAFFGNPKLGSNMFTSKQTAGIDLPMKALAWEDEKGTVWLGYNDPNYIAARHGITDRAEVVKKMSGALNKMSDIAIGAK